MAHTFLFGNVLKLLQHARRLNLEARDQHVKESWSRRRVLKTGLAVGTGLALGSLTAAKQNSQQRIAIVGAGLAGLNAAYQLRKAGIQATVYEGSSRLGGRVFSVTDPVGEGLTLDLGGSFINTEHEDILALAEEFGLPLFNRSEIIPTDVPESSYFFSGRGRSEAEVAEKLRPLAEQIAADAALLDEDFETYAPAFDELSVAQYLDQHENKIPDTFIRTLLENAVRTEYGVESHESSALQLLYLLPSVDGEAVEVLASDEAFEVVGGSSRIVEALSKALSGQIQTQMELTRLESYDNTFRLTFKNGQSVEAEYVILAIPFAVLQRLELQVELPETLWRFIHEASLGQNEKFFAGFTERVWQREGGFSNEIWTDLGFAEAWDATKRQNERHDGALTFFMGGHEVARTAELGSGDLGQTFLERLNLAVPGIKQAANHQFLHTAWAKNPLTRGGYSTFKPGQYSEFSAFMYLESEKVEERQDVNIGNLVFAGEHVSDEFYGYMNGAAQTGRLAADVVMRLLES
jgi:monoamine oxidase